MLVSCWCGGDLREMSRHHLLRTHRPDFCTTSTKKTSASTNQISSHYSSFITFRVSRRRREMYCVHARLSICVSVCVSVSAAACPHYCTDPDATYGSDRECPPSCALWADLQSVRGLRCYGNITQTRNVSEYMLALAPSIVSLISAQTARVISDGRKKIFLQEK